jgi:hypothetical protein
MFEYKGIYNSSNTESRNYARTGMKIPDSPTVNEKFTEIATSINQLSSLTGSSGGAINVTYAELVSLINISGLTINQTYKLTDYRTVHYMFDYNVRLNEINTGELEPLLLTAISTNSLSQIAKSTLYPQDIINYDWKSDYWIQDIAFATAENISGTTMSPDLTNVTLIPNYKGVIYRREDTKNNVILGYDFRHVKFRRWKFNYPIWDSGTTYNLDERVQVPSDGVYFSSVSGNTDNLVTDTTKWSKIIDYNLTEYWCCNSSDALDVNDFIDAYTFHGFDQWNTYDISVKDVIINSLNDTYTQFWGYIGSSLSNSVFYLGTNNDTYQSYTTFDINIAPFFELNTIGDDFNSNNIGILSNTNIIGNAFILNKIGNYFQSNIIGNTFGMNIAGNDFQGNIIEYQSVYNIIGNSFQSNTIGIGFQKNNIGDDFKNNNLEYNFFQNTIGNSFTQNKIKNNFYNNTIETYFFSNTIGYRFNKNSIGNSFNQNTVGNDFKNNTIGHGLQFNTIGNDFKINTVFSKIYNLTIPTGVTFQYNTIRDGIDFTGIDFSSSTHVYSTYNCDLFTTPNGTIKLSYCDNSGVIQVVNANA